MRQWLINRLAVNNPFNRTRKAHRTEAWCRGIAGLDPFCGLHPRVLAQFHDIADLARLGTSFPRRRLLEHVVGRTW